MTLSTPLVLVDALAEAIPSDKIVVLDCSWYMPAEARNPDADFENGHIPGAQRFDFDRAVAARDSDLPHMLPDADTFQGAARALGISGSTTVVCYDTAGMFAAPRAWWMFRAMGHVRVAVLNGGFPAWVAAGHPVEAGAATERAAGDLVATKDARWLRDAVSVKEALGDPSIAVLDARPAARFAGTVPEPRPNLRSGAMPGAANLQFTDLVSDGYMKSAADLDAQLAGVGATADRALVATCGSGVTASIIALAAAVTGRDRIAVYDGSWAEWGDERRQDLPVVRAGD